MKIQPLLRQNRVLFFGLFILLMVFMAGCQPKWEIQIDDGSNKQQVVTAVDWEKWRVYQDEDFGEDAILLDRVFSELEYLLIDQVNFTSPDGSILKYAWPTIAEDTWLMKNGQVKIADQLVKVSGIQVEPPLSYFQANASILDIASTVAAALDIPAPEQSIGQPLVSQQYERVMLLFLDGFGYIRYLHAIEDGLIPFLGSLEPPLMALTTFPPRTQVSSASVLTGSPPKIHGVYGKNIRKTDTETIFDVAAKEGLTVKAVEGNALSFEMRNADFKLSGDRNGDEETDDEVLANTLAVLDAGQPDLLWVHFHGVDDAGHSFGPGASEEKVMVSFVDAAVQEIISHLEPGTLVIIFADHGMHLISGDSSAGNHGNLIEEDMLIPIFIYSN